MSDPQEIIKAVRAAVIAGKKRDIGTSQLLLLCDLAGKRQTGYGWVEISVREDMLKALREVLDRLEPHEHRQGQNECLVCEENVVEAAVRILEKVPNAVASVLRAAHRRASTRSKRGSTGARARRSGGRRRAT